MKSSHSSRQIPTLFRPHPEGVTGVLTKSAKAKPTAEGTLIYINASPSIKTVLDKVERAGGKILLPVTNIKAGLIAIISDTEGNRLGLHAEA